MRLLANWCKHARRCTSVYLALARALRGSFPMSRATGSQRSQRDYNCDGSCLVSCTPGASDPSCRKCAVCRLEIFRQMITIVVLVVLCAQLLAYSESAACVQSDTLVVPTVVRFNSDADASYNAVTVLHQHPILQSIVSRSMNHDHVSHASPSSCVSAELWNTTH